MSYLPQRVASRSTGAVYQDLGVLDPRALNGWWDSVKEIGKDALTGAINVFGEGKKQEGITEAYKAQLEAQAAAQAGRGGGMPSWVLPAAIGGGALILVLALRKK